MAARGVVFESRFIAAVAGSALAVLLLSGCVPDAIHSKIDKHQHNYPERQLADFLATECQEIWMLSGRDSDSSPLYWLRAMDCA